MVDTLSLMTGIDIPIPECQLIAHQPTVKEISYLGEDLYFIGAQCLSINKSMTTSQDERDLENITNFQIFMTIMSDTEIKDRKQKVIQVLGLIFPQYKISITPRSIIFFNSDTQETSIIDEQNFDYLQLVLKDIFCFSSGRMDQSTFNPQDEKAKEIAEKLMRGRQRIAKEKNGDNNSVLSQYVSSLVIGLNSMSLNEIIELTLFQLYDLVERYGLYVAWDLDIRSRLAGASPDSQPDNWMKNIH